MGQAKQRGTLEQRIAQAKNKTIRHFTAPHFAEKIIQDGWIYTESQELSFIQRGYADMLDQLNPNNLTVRQQLEKDFKAIGQWVWLTESPRLHCNEHDVMNTTAVSFEFKAKDIGAIRWIDHIETLEKTPDVNEALYYLNTNLNGDNIRDFWVAPAINLDKCSYTFKDHRKAA